MADTAVSLPNLLDRLEAFYGPQQVYWPVDPYEFIVWWHCGYPQTDERCARGYAELQSLVGVQPYVILAASEEKLITAMKPGGMVPELRAMRLREIARRVVEQYGGDLRNALSGPIAGVRKNLKQFSNISDPGADRILLFAHAAPVAAVPSNCPHVLVRILHGPERENYGVTYREAQELIDAEVPAQFHARQRAYLLLKIHGRKTCKTKPLCDRCPVRDACAWAAGVDRGGRRTS